MSNAIIETIKQMERVGETTRSVCLGFSGGKDSVVLADLCKRFIPEVSFFYMYFLPGLEMVEREISIWEDAYQVKVHRIPSHRSNYYMREQFWCFPSKQRAQMGELKLEDCYAMAKAVSGADKVATGAKKTDNSWRVMWLEQNQDKYLFPLMKWKKADVLAYMRQRKLKPIELQGWKGANSANINTEFLYWLHDNNKPDWEKYCEVFPLLPVFIKHRDLYGAVKASHR